MQDCGSSNRGVCPHREQNSPYTVYKLTDRLRVRYCVCADINLHALVKKQWEGGGIDLHTIHPSLYATRGPKEGGGTSSFMLIWVKYEYIPWDAG